MGMIAINATHESVTLSFSRLRGEPINLDPIAEVCDANPNTSR
jgi:hypothetical protein